MVTKQCTSVHGSSVLTVAILVFLLFIIIFLVFFYRSKLLFSECLQFDGSFVRSQNNSKYRDWDPFNNASFCSFVCSFEVLKKMKLLVPIRSVSLARGNTHIFVCLQDGKLIVIGVESS